MGAYEFNFCDANAYVNENCIDRDVCTFDACDSAVCSHISGLHGDLVGPLGVCGPDGIVDLMDLIAVLDAFEGRFPTGCSEGNFDILSAVPDCTPDGVITGDDIFAVLKVLEGTPLCDCSQGLLAGSAGGELPSEPVGSATFVLVGTPEQAESGRLLAVDVLVRDVVDLRGYQLGLTVNSISSEKLSIKSLRIDSQRPNYVFRDFDSLSGSESFSGSKRFSALNTANGRIFAGLMGGSVTSPGVEYLGTFVFEVPEGVHGTFRFDLQLDDRTKLLDRFIRPMKLSVDSVSTSIDLP